MARQELSNIFQDGLMMDLNPINTPKSVLTDCLNGTYITYNGNEFVLQNDMGNYKLKNCKLPTNFIPVGVKGYGDILYIVSYNPITNETEIGSYPAPQSIFNTDNGSKDSDDNLIKFNINGTQIYNEVIKTQKHPIFIWTSNDDSNIFKLYPGDEFRWKSPIENELNIFTDYIYQHLNFYVIDEDNKLYDIDDEDMYDNSEEQLTDDGFRKVFWETPGWLAAQWDLFVPDKFNLNLRSLNVPEFLLRSDIDTQIVEEDKDPVNTFRVEMVLSTQTIISDPLFQQTLNKYFDKPVYKHLYIRFILNNPGNYVPDSEKPNEKQLLGEFLGYQTDNTAIGDLEPSESNCIKDAEGNIIQYIIDVPCNKHNYQDDITTAYTSGSAIWRFTNPLKDNIANYPGYVECTAYPMIKQEVYDLTDSDNPVIVKNKYNVLEFTQFESNLRFELNNLKEPDSITIADQMYKWAVDDDSCTVSFNINGPFINVEGITGKYEIYRINLFNYIEGEPNPESDPQSDSYSTWTSAIWKTPDQEPIDFTINPRYYLIKEDDKYTREQIKGWQNSQRNEGYLVKGNRPILLCSGDIPSLVLYGQNTLNIDWSTSDKIELSGYKNWYKDIDTNTYVLSTPESSKVLAFEEEGGIYILRIILKQAGSESELRSSEQILIPSKVFNDYFGTYDNYLNSITSSMWLGNWMNYISQNVSINKISLDFTRDTAITENTVWNGFYILPGEKKFVPHWVENPETGESSIDWEQTIADNIKTFKTGNAYEWESTPTPFTYKIDLNELSPKIDTYSGDTTINKLEGNLWNGIITSKLTLKTSDGQDIFTQDNGSDDLQLIRELDFDCTTDSLGRVDKHDVITPESFAFVNDSSRISILHSNANQKDSTRTRVSLTINEDKYTYNTTNAAWTSSSDKREWDDKSKTVTDSNGPTFPLIGDLMSTSPATSWAYIKFTAEGSRSANSRVVLVQDSDEDDDKGGTNIDTSESPVEGVILFAVGGKSTLINKTVFLKTTNNEITKRILWALMHIKYGKNSESSTPVYYPTFRVQNIIESEQLNVSKFETDIQLRYLRVDDEILLNESAILTDFNELLFKDPLVSLNKTLSGSTPNILVILDYTTNNLYKEFITNITSGFMDYNQTQESKRIEVENTPVGDYLKYSEEGYEFPQGEGRKVFTGKDLAGDPSDINTIKSDAQIIIDSLYKRNSGNPYSISNIGYNNSSINTFKYLNKKGSSNVVDNTSTAMMCYVQDITL